MNVREQTSDLPQQINETHGGNLEQASRDYGIALTQWLDLSTGIAPWSYPVGDVPAAIWQRLPGENQALVQAASDYYGCAAECITPVAGSQQAIQLLPELFQSCGVAVPALGYFEHRKAWQKAGHRLHDYKPEDASALDQLLQDSRVKVAVVINPNNPSTDRFSKEQLMTWADRLAHRGGCLIVDEAFMDLTPQQSLATLCPPPGLIVLRSLGKFFGLAGLRLGFVLAAPLIGKLLNERLPGWHINSPAQYAGQRALADRNWQQSQSERIDRGQAQLLQVLQQYLPDDFQVRAAGLFISVLAPAGDALQLFETLARQGIWIRRFLLPENRCCLRFGLVADDQQLQRLIEVLSDFNR